ncbi:MAG: guanylate kinase [Oscillospiraceae bacterium]|nr:guanylate kinase [Oscillospiraceae bacterium]
MSKKILLVLTGPSGSGKGTVLGEYRKDHDVYFSISNTTRGPRPGEIDGVHYHFITREAFEEKIRQGSMLEYAQYCDNYYGSPRDKAEEQMKAGRSVILEIEAQGAMQVKKNCPESVRIFIVPPSMEVLRARLIGRGTEDMETVEKRLAKAIDEIAKIDEFDYVVINDQLADAVHDFTEIVDACEQEEEDHIAALKEKAVGLKAYVRAEFLK